MEASPSAESVLGTATLASSESAMPPASGNAATANCCAPAVVVTTAAAPRPDTVPDCAAARAGASAKALTTASAPRREIIVAVIVRFPPEWSAQSPLWRWMLPPVRYAALWSAMVMSRKSVPRPGSPLSHAAFTVNAYVPFLDGSSLSLTVPDPDQVRQFGAPATGPKLPAVTRPWKSKVPNAHVGDAGFTPSGQCCTNWISPPVGFASKPKVAKSRLSPSFPPPVIWPVVWPVVAVQLTEKAAVAVPPDGTVTVCELPPLTVQFVATPESATLWLPGASPGKVTLPLIPMGWLLVPSTVTV